MSTLQAQRTVQEVIFGPYESRRFGKSLGVNPLPRGARFCNFSCIYCECASAPWPIQWDLRPQFPDAEAIRDALATFADSFEGGDLDSITITGNGEPTLSPHLEEIVDVVSEARDRDWPQARTVLLTNGSMCHRTNVRSAAAKLDQRIVKLDAGTSWILDQMNRPGGKLSITELRRRISMMPEIIVQSMFVHGPVDNTLPEHVEVWTEWLKRLAPLSVQIYSLDRVPARHWVQQVPRFELESIAQYVESTTALSTHVF